MRIAVHARQILATAGAQQALDLTADELLPEALRAGVSFTPGALFYP